jgi:outer membrane protein assembly factor BamB
MTGFRSAAWLTLLWLTGCSGASVQPPAELRDFSARYKLDEVWSMSVGKGARGVALRPQMQGNMLYAADTRGRVIALNAEQGSVLWETDLDKPVTGGVGVGDGLVLVTTRHGDVHALHIDTGKPVWQASLSSEALAPAVAAAGTVVVQTADGRLTALDTRSGQRLWVIERSEPALSLRGTGAPVLVPGAVMAGFSSGRIAAFEVKSGRQLWEVPVTQPRGRSEIERLVDIDADIVLSGRALYAVSYQGRLVAMSLDDGRLLWTREVSSYSGLAVAGNTLVLSDEHGTIIALDARDGSERWKQEGLARRRVSTPAITRDVVVIGDYDGYVHLLSLDKGEFVGRDRLGSGLIRVRPVVDGDMIYVANIDGKLQAWRLQPR